MARNFIHKSILVAAATASLALGAGEAGAMGAGGGSSSILAPSASPYAILAPITVERTPGGEGRAAFEGYSSAAASRCQPGSHAVLYPNGEGWNCKLDR
jgi:hypothetical protein